MICRRAESHRMTEKKWYDCDYTQYVLVSTSKPTLPETFHLRSVDSKRQYMRQNHGGGENGARPKERRRLELGLSVVDHKGAPHCQKSGGHPNGPFGGCREETRNIAQVVDGDHSNRQVEKSLDGGVKVVSEEKG